MERIHRGSGFLPLGRKADLFYFRRSHHCAKKAAHAVVSGSRNAIYICRLIFRPVTGSCRCKQITFCCTLLGVPILCNGTVRRADIAPGCRSRGHVNPFCHAHNLTELVEETPELQVCQQLPGFFFQRFQGIGVQLQIQPRHFRINSSQLLGKQSLLLIACQLFLQAFAFYLVHMLQHVFHAAVLPDQLQGRLGTYPGHAGNVVRSIAHKAFQVNELQGDQPLVILCKSGFIIQFDIGNALLRVHDPGAVVDELQFVPVPGHDIHFHRRIRLFRKGTDDIIRFVIIQLQRRDAHGLQHLHAQGELFLQLRRRGFPLAFVIRIQLRTECLPGFIKRRSDPAGFHILQQLVEHAQKSVHSPGVLPFAGSQGRQGEKGPVDQAASVNYQKFICHSHLLKQVLLLKNL